MLYNKWIIKETKKGFTIELDDTDKTNRKEQKEFYPVATMGGFMMYFPRNSEFGNEYYKNYLIDFAVKQIQEKIDFYVVLKSKLQELKDA